MQVVETTSYRGTIDIQLTAVTKQADGSLGGPTVVDRQGQSLWNMSAIYGPAGDGEGRHLRAEAAAAGPVGFGGCICELGKLVSPAAYGMGQ